MELTSEQKSTSICNIRKFMSVNEIKYGNESICNIDIYKNNHIYIGNTCRCMFSYSEKYMQIQVYIYWKLGSEIQKRNNLKGVYNSNFNIFEVKGDKLLVLDDVNVIEIKKL